MLDKVPPFLRNLLFFQVYELIPDTLKKQFRRLLFLMLVLACVETAGVGLIAFYAAAVSDPLSTLNLPVFQTLKAFPYIGPLVSSSKLLIGSLSVFVIVFLPLKNSYRGLVAYQIARSSALMEAFFGQRLLEVLLARDYIWHLEQNSADLVQYVNWRHHFGRNFVGPSLKVICEVAMLIVMFVGLLIAQPIISILFIMVQGVAVFLVFRLLKRGLDVSAAGCRASEMTMSRYATRAIHAIKDVKITGSERVFIRGFSEHSSQFARLFGRQQFWRESPLLVLETFGFVMIACSILFMMYGLGYSPLEITGTTALLAVAGWRTLPAFNRILTALTTIRTSRPYVINLLNELQIDPQEHFIQSDIDNKLTFEKEIQFKNVDFSYVENLPVLKKFSIKINKGLSVGIMGPSGCGKSTFVDLLCGLLRPDFGKILIDNQSLNSRNIATWRQFIGYVPQSPYIFDGSLAENIAFGVPIDQIDMQQVEQCCTKASVDFLERLPRGVMTDIGERGVKLSGGQRQRVAIARALYRSPKILIFDEATSALDPAKDKEIRELISSLKGTLTLIIVSHRISSIKGCDVIYDFAPCP